MSTSYSPHHRHSLPEPPGAEPAGGRQIQHNRLKWRLPSPRSTQHIWNIDDNAWEPNSRHYRHKWQVWQNANDNG